MFAEFGDTGCPSEFRGLRRLAVTDTPTLDEVAQRWDQLSPATREALDPFFIPPFNPGSWYEPASAAACARSPGPRAAAGPGEPGPTCATNTAPNMNRWGYVTAVGGKVRVWYENTRAGQLDKAISVAEYLDSGVWGKVIGVFREPLMDGGDLTGQRCRGFDPAIDFVLSRLSAARTAAPSPTRTTADCQGPAAGFVLVKRELTGKELMSTVAHELAHLGRTPSPRTTAARGISWLAEATAAWVENYVGGLGPDHPEQFAPYFFDRPKLSLETNEPETATPRQYGSYLFFQWLAKTQGRGGGQQDLGAQPRIGGHPIDTIQAALHGARLRGRLRGGVEAVRPRRPEPAPGRRLVQAVGNADAAPRSIAIACSQTVTARRSPSPSPICRPSTTGSTSPTP